MAQEQAEAVGRSTDITMHMTTAIGQVASNVGRLARVKEQVGVSAEKVKEMGKRSGEIGYWVAAPATGKGIATEATARVLQIAFEELDMHRVILRIAEGNIASERIAEKLGFVQEGILRKEVLVHGVWMDHSLWGLLDEEYREQRARYADAGWLTQLS